MLRKKKGLCFAIALALSLSFIPNKGFVNAATTSSINQEVNKSQITLIEGNSTWSYEDSNTDYYLKKFYNDSFDESTWKSGKAPLGYPATDKNQTFGEVSKGTLVNGVKKPNAIITYYFKKEFNVKDVKSIKNLEATVGIDDGFVMYLNGQEINRTYMDNGDVTHSSTANLVNEPSDPEGTVKLNLTSAIDKLVEGKNEIAVSVHNRDNNSSDIYFDMSLVASTEASSEGGGGTENPGDPNVEDEKAIPKQVNVHMGDNPSSEVNLTYTTILGGLDTKVLLNKVGSEEKIEALGENSIGAADKYFHKIEVKSLEPNTKYEYKVGTGVNTFSGTFKTAPAQGSKDTFKFAYLADTQVANETDAKALGATFAEVNKMKDLSFVYMAGDVTNTATSESQWEQLFNNKGAYPTGGQDLFGNNLVSVVQGNHDNNTMNKHINAPAEVGNIVYSYDYGPATFVMLNLETARYDATAREQQKEYLIKAVSDAKARGQWTIVGYHKSLYTGASHITDSDVTEARKYWSPIFASLDVDVIMQGHDHVYSRGFINSAGYNANPIKREDGKIEKPSNAPLYMVGGHAGGLKWYSKKNYTVGAGDPLAPGYTFLDVNSTDTGSDVKKEQVIVEMEVSNKEIKLNTYMFKYDTTTDTITTEKYLYDSMTAVRNVTTADITGDELGVLEKNQEVEYTVSLSDIKDTNAYEIQLEYNPEDVEFVDSKSLLNDTIFTDVKNENGKVAFTLGTSTLSTSREKLDVAKFKFKLKENSNSENTKIKLVKADSAQAIVTDGEVTGAIDKSPIYNTVDVTTTIHSYKKASDINKDGRITLADLSIALGNYRTSNKKCDIDLDKYVDTKDFILIKSYFAA